MKNIQYNYKVKFILSLIKFFRIKNIDYIILGNPDNLFSKRVNDLDIFIKYKNFQFIKNYLLEFAKKNNFYLTNIIQHEYNSYSVIFSSIHNNEINFALDISNNYVINSKTILNINEKNFAVVKKKNFKFKFLTPDKQFVYYFYKKIYKKNIDLKSFKYLKSLYKNLDIKRKKIFYSSKQIQALDKFFKKDETKNLDLILEYFIKKTKKSFYSNSIREYLRILKRLKIKTGLHVVFLGIDGSGKSTLIKNIEKEFERGNVLYFKKFSKFHNFNNISTDKQSIPFQKKDYGRFLSLIKILYLAFKYAKHYIFFIYPSLLKTYLVLNDRYYQDILINPSRYRIGYFHTLLKYIFKCFPNPDIIFLLKVDKKILIKRKKELNNYQVKKNINFINKFIKENNQIISIDANLNKNALLKNVFHKIKKFQHKKNNI
jgi:thymidylate kinase